MKFPRTISPEALVRAIYRKLAQSWGPQHWWPAETPFEVIVGAVLTQNTSWTNVERSMDSLRSAGALNASAIRALPLETLETLVRSSGYYRQKARRLKNFVSFLDEKYDGSLQTMFAAPTAKLRRELLALNGIGQETADAILLYGGRHEVFVVDAYARRILMRHAAIAESAKYDEVRLLVERALQHEKPFVSNPEKLLAGRPSVHQPSPMSSAEGTPLAHVFNEMHGLIVQTGKHYCYKAEPKCEACPLRIFLPQAQLSPGSR